MSSYYVGVDVGSFSVRSGLFVISDKVLKLINKCEININVFNDRENIYEQSSENIWDSVCKATQQVIRDNEINPVLIKGIGFDATCSLVALRKNGRPLSVSITNQDDRNIIMWMDLRAKKETDIINNLHLKALKTFGGKISIEMQPPKLLWLKHNIPNFMENVELLFDLPDYLVYRATGSKTRSLCSVTCKWAFDAENYCWDKEFWKKCNLEELCDNNFSIIGNDFCYPGSIVSSGLSESAAVNLGLKPFISVPASLIDAYAGVLGAIKTSKQLITIAGTSACHMIVTPKPIYIQGIWGPYKNVLIKDYYILESGQTMVGNLLDRILMISKSVMSHKEAINQLMKQIDMVYNFDKDIFDISSNQWYNLNILTKDLHINPDFAGNRSPRSDPDIRGSIIGVSIDSSESYVAKLYLATIHSIMYGFKEILHQLLINDVEVDSIVLCGGLSKNPIFSRVLADVSELPVILTQDEDLVLLGAAKLNILNSIQLFQENNFSNITKIEPDGLLAGYHRQKYNIYSKIIDFQSEIKHAILIQNVENA